MSSAQIADIWFAKWRRDVHDFAEFVVLIKELAGAYPGRRFVVRPHPSESVLFYRRAFSTLTNVDVVREGNVLNWIRGASLVVHSNCTTGIEAVLAGRPVLNFLPGDEAREHLDVEVAREAGAEAGSVSAALEIAAALLAKGASTPRWSTHAASILNNLAQDAIPLLVEETLAVMRGQGITGSKLVLPPSRQLRKWAKRLLGRSKQGYIAQKRGTLERAHVERVLAGCRSEGVGAGRIALLRPDYVVIDPI